MVIANQTVRVVIPGLHLWVAEAWGILVTAQDHSLGK